MKITKEQIQNLILNSYGFLADDKYNTLYYYQEGYVNDDTFELANTDGDFIEFSYNNAEVKNGRVSFETSMGKPIEFTVFMNRPGSTLLDVRECNHHGLPEQ